MSTSEFKVFSRRVLRRTIIQSARNTYTCDMCQGLLNEGEEYEVEVVAIRAFVPEFGKQRKYLKVWRTHRTCDPEPEDEENNEDAHELLQHSDHRLPLAA